MPKLISAALPALPPAAAKNPKMPSRKKSGSETAVTTTAPREICSQKETLESLFLFEEFDNLSTCDK
jgi:hypothetical protein